MKCNILSELLIFELSYEVANKVGGIYTVLGSKAAYMARHAKNYFLVGPYIPRKAVTEFEREPPSKEFAAVFRELRRRYGIECYSGHWLVPGRPKCLLVDPSTFFKHKDEIKYGLWEQYGVDSWQSGMDFDEPVVWATAAGMLVERLKHAVFSEDRCIAHAHEWLAGPALLYLRNTAPEIKTVFTTHATILGRTLAESGHDLYAYISRVLVGKKESPDEKARQLFIHPKHLTEKACALNATVFTTVSENTAREARALLGRKPEVVTPNGLNMDDFPLMEELSSKHIKFRERLRSFIMHYFAPYYPINLEKTLLFFISGRFEMRNKGIDLLIDALALLNQKLKQTTSDRTVVVFIWVPTATKGVNIELLKHMTLYKRLEDEISEEVKNVKRRMYYAISQGKPIPRASLLDTRFQRRVKKILYDLKHPKGDCPPLSAFELTSDNPILARLRERGLNNSQEDRVKVIYYPRYLSSSDGLLGLEYYDAIMGCHLGIFPSYYEPWGYTPLECMAHGLPAVTTDLAGFGKFMLSVLQSLEGTAQYAIHIVRREGVPYEHSVKDLSSFLFEFSQLGKRARINAKIKAKELSYLSDWALLMHHYCNAYKLCFMP